MFYNLKNDINLDHLNNKKHCNEATAINDPTPPASTLIKHDSRYNYPEESIPFLREYDPSAPYPIVSSLMHHNGSNSSGIGSFSGPGNHHYGGPNMRNLCQRDGRIVSTDVEDLSTDEDNTCPASNKGVQDEMFDSISSNPASCIMHQEMSHPSALLNSIPPPPSEPPPSTPRDSFQESSYPKGTMMITGSHGGVHGMRSMMDHDHILQQIPGVMEADPIPISYLMTQTNNRMPVMYSSSSNGPTSMPAIGTIGRYRNQQNMNDNAAMSTLPHTHSQNGFGTGIITRGPGSVGGNSNVYENPYNSLSRQKSKHIQVGAVGKFPVSSSNHDMGYPVLTQSGIPQNHLLYRQGSIRSPPQQSYSDPFFGIGKEGGGKCSWNCIRISLFSLAILLLLSLIAYFAAKSVWLEGRLNKRFAQDPVVIGLFDPNNLPMILTPLKPVLIHLKPMGVWSGRWIQNRSDYIHFNFTINAATNLGVFLRLNSVPTIVRYSFFDRVSGYRWKQKILDPNRNRVKRSSEESYQQESTGIVNYLEKGLWFVSVVNDQPREENIQFTLNTKVTMKAACPEYCNKHGLCTESGLCECFTGFKGRDCSIVDAPEVCTGHGNYFQGRCLCNPEWKGIECQTIWYECEQSACSGNGDCVSGDCVCKPGYGGRNCSNVLCLADCSQHGVCLKNGICKCFQGWNGLDCSKKVESEYKLRNIKCINNGKLSSEGVCKCTKDYEGDLCEKRRCFKPCINGQCMVSGLCKCNKGYQGELCDKSMCDKRCYKHGTCIEGNCICNKGWNGKHCTLDGCPSQCNNRGQCNINSINEYECLCLPTWKGDACNISKEKDCDDGVDNDNDLLIDCQDPDCCPTDHCEALTNQKQKLAEESCPLMDSLQLLLLTTKLARPGSAFHEQIEFLTKRKYTSSTLNENKISVVRGRVVQNDGSSFQGCRIQDRLRPANGHTFTDKQGIFDLVVEGGSLVQLEIIRHPGSRFTGFYNVYVPINEFVNIGNFELKDLLLYVSNNPPVNHGCVIRERSVHDSSTLDGPRLLVDWSSEIVPIFETDTLSMAIDNGVLLNSIDLKETKLKLMHRSSRVKGFKSAMIVVILGENVPLQLKEVILHIDVAGQLISKRLEPDPYLTYTFYWDRLNAYSRKMYGIAQVKVRAGYIYWNCSRTFWETKLTPINGHDLAAKDIGNWNLNIRHIYDYHHGIVYRGDGSHIFFTETNWKINPIAGIANEKRDINNCVGCDGTPLEKKFLALNSIVSDDKGRVIIVDGKYIRILSKASENSAKWVMMAPYYMKFIQQYETFSKNPVIYLTKHENNPAAPNDITSGDQKVYVSVAHLGSIWMVNPAKETHTLIIGETCDDNNCIKEKLIYPKGMAMSYNFSLYFADGRSIKMFSYKFKEIVTVAGDASALSQHARLPDCYEGYPASKARLKWPTQVLYNPVDDSIYFVDNMDMVYRIGLDNLLMTTFAGNSLDCPLPSTRSETIPANRYNFEEIRDIAFSPSGELYIAEKKNVWVVKADGYLYAVAGTKHHSQFQTKGLFMSITSITVTMYGQLIVADNGVYQLYSVHYVLPVLKNGQYQVLSSDTRELYSFNTDGQHVNTDSSITGTKLYSLHFRLHSINGWLSKILSPSGMFQFKVHRDTQSRPTQLETPSGIKYNVTLDEQKRITSLAMPTCTWRFEYNDQDLLVSIQECQQIVPYRFTYYSNSGRLQSVIRPSGVTTTFEEHPMFYEYIRKKYKENNLFKGVDRYQLGDAALTPHSSLFYSSLSRTFIANKATNILFLQLKMVGPSTQIKFTNGFQPKEMSLLDSQFKIQYPTHYELYYHLTTNIGMKFIRKIVMKTMKPMKPHKSEWIYKISQTSSTHVRRKRSNKKLLRNYMVSNDDYESNDESTTVQFGYPRTLKVNGRKRLQIQYESHMKEEYYSRFDGEKTSLLFRILYNEDYQVTKITFSNLTEVVVSYLSTGKVSEISWPKAILQIEYDRFNRTSVLFNAFINEKLHYKYEDQSSNDKLKEISRGSNARYQLMYDIHDKLMSVKTPNNIPIEITQLISLGYRRILYQPYGVSFNFIYDFDTLHGNLFRLIYPSRAYQINFFYSTEDQLSDVIYGSDRITWFYNTSTALIQTLIKQDYSRGFLLQQNVEYDGPFLIQLNSTITLPSPNLDIVIYNSLVLYNYDSDMLISKINLILHDPTRTQVDLRLESTLIYNFLSQRIQWDEFKFQLEPIDKIKLPLENSFIITKYNQNGQIQSRILTINNNEISLYVYYNEINKNPLLISSFKIKKSNNNNNEIDTKFSYYMDSATVTNVHNSDYIQYKYYADGRLKSMRINAGAPIEYIYDEKTGLLITCGLVSYLHNDDGFLTQKRTGQYREKFSYNAFGLLKEYSKESNQNVTMKVEYFYDSKHRIILQRDLTNPKVMLQYFYTDPVYPKRLTHMLDSRMNQLSTYYYDSCTGHLFSIRVDKTFYYVLSDFLGSPRVIVSQNFEVVWERDYDIFGEFKSLKDWIVHVPIGYAGSISDQYSRMLFMKNRMYDPNGKSFAGFEWSSLFSQLINIKLNPLALNSYQFHYFPNTFDYLLKTDFSNFLKADLWMKKIGVNVDFFVAEQPLILYKDIVSLPSIFVLKYAFNQFKMDSVHTCLAEHNTKGFQELHSLETSDLVSQDLLPYSLSQVPQIPTNLFSFHPNISISIMKGGALSMVTKIDNLDSPFKLIANALFRNTTLIDIFCSRRDIILIFLVKLSCTILMLDLRELGMVDKSQQSFGHNLNLSVIYHENKMTEVILHQRYFIISVRYCSNVQKQTSLIKEHLKSESEKVFWVNKRSQLNRDELIQDQIITDSKDELRKFGLLRSMTFENWYNVTEFPLLFDDLSVYKIRRLMSP